MLDSFGNTKLQINRKKKIKYLSPNGNVINSPTFVRRCVSAYSRNFRGSYKRTQLFYFLFKNAWFPAWQEVRRWNSSEYNLAYKPSYRSVFNKLVFRAKDGKTQSRLNALTRFISCCDPLTVNFRTLFNLMWPLLSKMLVSWFIRQKQNEVEQFLTGWSLRSNLTNWIPQCLKTEISTSLNKYLFIK